MSIFELVQERGAPLQVRLGHRHATSRKLRGRMEKLSGGGTSSGLMSFLEVLDRGAGATKSGGTTRRAAKMVVPRHGPPRDRRLHPLEGARGEEGRAR